MAIAEALKKNIDTAIHSDKPIKIRAFAILPDTEAGLNYIIESILVKYNRDDLQAPVYTAIKELALNGAKANIKKILFEEIEMSMDIDHDYNQGMAQFKDSMNEEWILKYANKAKERNMFVDVVFDYNPHRLIIEVVNNRPISEKEDLRIREKFKTALKYDDIAQFYMEGGDNSEGAGMGIVLITMLLRGQEIDPHMFTIRSNYRNSTIAKIEFPLSKFYMSSRERFKRRYSA